MFRYERSPVLEDGEIRDEADEPYSPSDYDAEGIISHISTNSDAQLTSWTSLDEEREVDRIIAEMQGFVHDERANQCGGDDVVDDEESLRRAAIVSAQKRRRQLTQIAASMSEQGAFYKEQTSPTVAQGTSDATLEAVSAVHPRSARHGGSTKSTWVRLDSSRSNAKGGLRRSSMNRVEPLVVTVANDTRRDCGGHLALHGNIPEGELAWSNEYDEALHNIRLRFEQDVATAIEKDVEGGLGDNYEQVGMDIVDSDRDEPSVDDEAERLRAALLEQVMRKKHLEEGAETALNNREEGEVSGSTTPIHSPGVTQRAPPLQSRSVKCNSSAVVPSSSLEHNCNARSIRSVVTPSKDSRLGRKRSARQRRSNSSDNETTVLSDFSDAPPRKRSNTKRKTKSSGRGAAHRSADISCVPSREHNLEEWERLLEEEAEEKRLIENKMRHREAQRSMNANKRDRYIERAYRCCHEIGFLDSELMMLKGDLEKVKGRISFFEKECEKARRAESRRTAEKKSAERSRNKEICRRRMSGNSVAAVDVDDLRSSYINLAEKETKEVDSGAADLAELNTDKCYENPGETGVPTWSEPHNDERRLENMDAGSTESGKVAMKKGVCRTEELVSRTPSKESLDKREAEMILEPEQELQFTVNVAGGASENIEVQEERNEALRSSSDEDLENWCLLDSAEQGCSDADCLDKRCRRLLPSNPKPAAMQFLDDRGFCFEDFDEDAVSGTTHHSETSSSQREMMITSNNEAATVSEMGLCSGSTSSVSYDDGNFAELRDNLLLRFSGYRICPTFPYSLITHRSISNKLDPMRPLCYYELHGICKDKFCTMQHESEYLMTDEEVLCSVFAHCPDLCPSEKMFSEYASELLRKWPSKPVGQLVAELLNAVPESSRVIKACDMVSRCGPEPAFEDSDERMTLYNIWPTLKSSVLHNASVSPTPHSYLT